MRDSDRYFLCFCLTGAAAQILTCNREAKSADRISKLLETRSGTEDRCKVYRLELKKNMDLLDLWAKDFYLDALNDHSFKIQILERKPKTLDQISVACLIETEFRKSCLK